MGIFKNRLHFDLYLNNGGKLSYEECLASIKGEKGDTGYVKVLKYEN